jgi:hypothetical protein
VVREYRLVDNRSTAMPLLVPEPGGNTKVWSLVEAQAPWFGSGLEGQETMRESWKRHSITV